MKNKRLIAILLFIFSWSYMIYKLCVYDDYGLLFAKLSNLPVSNYFLLLGVLFLMPFNIFFEILKWHISVNRVNEQTLLCSFRQVMLGNAGAFITPYRIGEHPSRAYYIENRDVFFAAVALGFIGTVALEIINIGVGLPASVFYFDNTQPAVVFIVYGAVLFMALLLFMLLPSIGAHFKKRKIQNKQTIQMIDTLCGLDKKYLINLLFLSLLRYIVYSLQLWLALKFFQVDLSPLQAIIAIPTYYLLVSVTPSLPIADAAVRGSWSIIVFQTYTADTPSIAFAAVLLWLINTALPLIILPFIKNYKI